MPFFKKTETKAPDFLIIGAGIAGLVAAHLLSQKGQVLVITKGKLKQSNTYWAQGGIAAVMGKDDHFENHIKDTLTAGAHHNNEHAVRFLVEHAPKAIRFLEELGVNFQEKPALEGGHSKARVWRTSDFTGQDILTQLIKVVKKNKAITLQQESEAVELIVQGGRCDGVWVRQGKKNDLEALHSPHTILATGGMGQLFGRTTNTIGSGGDGVGLAMQAGLKMNDLEFIQFHPTAFAEPEGGRYFLLSEALRGFGAKVVNRNGQVFLNKFHPKAELAPRDILARTIFFELMNGPVYLDMRHLEAAEVRGHFPNIAKRLKLHNLDLTADLIPITPVAHYACGGVPVNEQGATELPGLYAVGEVAHTGVHGANRLASNSLLEAVVFAQSLAEKTNPSTKKSSASIPKPPTLNFESVAHLKAYSQRIGRLMWEHVGIVRTQKGLQEAKRKITNIPARDTRIQNRQKVCTAIIDACLSRTESLGTHFITSDI